MFRKMLILASLTTSLVLVLMALAKEEPRGAVITIPGERFFPEGIAGDAEGPECVKVSPGLVK